MLNKSEIWTSFVHCMKLNVRKVSSRHEKKLSLRVVFATEVNLVNPKVHDVYRV